MSAREDILAAVRGALGRLSVDADQVKEEADRLLDDLPAARPALDGMVPIDIFAARVSSPKVAASLDRIGDLAELPTAVERYLQSKGLPRNVALQPAAELQALDWHGIALHDAPEVDECVGVGIARAGIAETGSLVFESGPETPVLAHFLPLHHIVLVRAHSIVMYLDDYAAAALNPESPPHRNVNLITGASGTTDIEGSLVLGAHGPCHLHVVILFDGKRSVTPQAWL